MVTEWTIAADSTQIELDAQGQGTVSFVVTNTGPMDDQAVFAVIAGDEFHQSSFTVDQPEQISFRLCELHIQPGSHHHNARHLRTRGNR